MADVYGIYLYLTNKCTTTLPKQYQNFIKGFYPALSEKGDGMAVGWGENVATKKDGGVALKEKFLAVC
jgi:hypothetical protein